MKSRNCLPYLFTVVCTIIYLSLVFNDNVWMDEAFSASIIRCGFDEMVSRTFADTLPPFYNFSAWLFTQIAGFSTIKLKIFSVVPMTLLMLTAAHFIPRIVSVRAACLYIVMLTAMPHFLEHGIEIRMYSWAVFFASATAIFAVCSMKDIPYADILQVVSTVCGAYTHQYALIAEAFIWLMLLTISVRKRKVRHWGIMAAVCIVLYLPCAILTFFQMKSAASYFSAAPATFDSLMSSIRYPFVTNVTFLSALLLIFVLLLFAYLCRKGEYIYIYCILVYIFVTAMSFGFMHATGSSFFSSRYLLPAVGILWFGVSVALDMLISENRYVFIAAALLAAASLIVVYIQQFRTEYTDLSEFIGFIDSTGEGDGYVMYEDFPEIGICLEYYAPWMKSCSVDEIGEVPGNKYVFVNRNMHTDDIEKINEKDYTLRYIENLSFDRYTFRAYELTAE